MLTYLATLEKKQILTLLGTLTALCILLIFTTSCIVWINGKAKSTDKLTDLEPQVIGIVLGTSAKVAGRDNLYYKYRIEAAERLYKSGKVKFFLLSGANPSQYYNEPMTMQNDLVERGIPADLIQLDYAGLRTLDSVVRAQKVFGVTEAVFISQAFHNHRAIYIAEHIGIKATGFNAQDVKSIRTSRIHLREVLARVKMLLDLHILNTQPKHLGEPIPLPILTEGKP